MKRVNLTLILFVCMLAFLSACTSEPKVFGVPQSQWEAMDADQRMQLSQTFLKEERLSHEPPIFGVPAPEWDKMNEQQRDQAIKAYQEQQRIAEEARERESARQHELDVIHAKQEPEQQMIDAIPAAVAGSTAHHHKKNHIRGKSVRVGLSGGMVNFSNIDGYSGFKPMSFSIKDGEAKKVELIKSGDNFFGSKVNLGVRYDDGVVYLDTEHDPFHGRSADPSTHLTYETDWKRGHTYNGIHTNGKASLKNVTVKVQVLH